MTEERFVQPNLEPRGWWEIPLAAGSFCCFKTARLLVNFLLRWQVARFNRHGFRWSVLTPDTVKSPLTLAVLMTKGPRWNPHAVIGSAGPFRVTESMAVNRQQADASSGSWTLVIYRYPGLETVACLSSSRALPGEWLSQSLPPGKYSLGMRYYDLAGPVLLPAVRVDGQELLPSRLAPPDPNSFYQDLHRRTNWFYSALHYYVFPMLKWESHLPAAFVRSEYLPVGDPGTRFYYGALGRGQALECEFPAGLLENYRAYYTQYNRASLPVFWSEILSGPYRTPLAAAAGFYLLRLRPRGEPVVTSEAPALRLRVCAAPNPPSGGPRRSGLVSV